MYEVTVLVLETKKEFTKTFYDRSKYEKFKYRCDHSNKVKITAVVIW